MGQLDGKVAIVTGGASGIGAAAVRDFAREGAFVMSADVDEENGQAVVREICESGGRAVFHRTDVSKAREVEELVQATVRQFGGMDVLFANAAIQVTKSLTDTTEDDWDRLMSVNLKGIFFSCKYAVLQMLEQGRGGSIIAMSSVNGLAAEPELAAYCASKGAVISLVKSIATDYGKYNIRANCLCPGYVDTPLGDVYFNAQPDPEEERRKAGSLHLLNRIAAPVEIARCATFLASDAASFITGSSLLVDGGLIAKV